MDTIAGGASFAPRRWSLPALATGHAQQLLVLVDRLDDAGQEHEEAQVLHGVLARLEQVAPVGGQRPVVVLARAVDALEGLLVLQAHQAMMAREQAHLLHGQQVVVDGAVGVLEDGRQLVLRGSHLVVLRLGGHAELPQLVIELLHELVDRGANGAEVVVVKLLALARRIAEQRAVRQHQVETLLVLLLRDEEVFLLAADRDIDAAALLAEQRQHAVGLLFDDRHAAQKRRLLVERLARVAAERRGDAQHLVLDERVARGIPRRVAARLERGAQAAVREARGIGLALDELFAR